MSDATSLTVPFARPSISEEEKQAVLEILDSGWLTTGKKALEFENNFSAFMNKIDTTKKRKELSLNTNPVISLAVNSNTSGMILAMEACGVTNNTAVITTPYTFVSTAMCARHLGADVYFADVEKDSYNIDVANIEKILQNDTEHKIKAIVPVHIAGALCNMEKICALAKKYNVKVIDLLKREELAVLNTISTAEGTIQIAMEETMRTIHGSSVLVMGFGRIGKILCKMLARSWCKSVCGS